MSGPLNAGNRSYRVALGKTHEVVRGFEAQWAIAGGASQLCRVFAMDFDTFHGRGQTQLEQNEYLLKTGQVDKRWLRAVA